MKKKFLTKALALMLCAFTAIPMVACNDDNVGVGGEAIDASKTQLNVWHYFAGFRDEWLVELKNNFEKAFANVKFEEGKMGVQVHHRGEMKADWTASSMADSPYEVFFMEGPQNYLGIMAEGGVESLSSIMTTANPDDNNQTIESKMTQQQKDFYNYNGNYYGIPYYTGNYGIIYNRDLFNEKGFYLAETPDEETGNILITSTNPTKSKGPDGKSGTEDDGLPTTYDEFFALCMAINKRQVDPIMVNGQHVDQYVTMLMDNLIAAHDGLEQNTLNYTFDGTATNLVKIENGNVVLENGKPVTESMEINESNAYNLSRQEGKYYAASFIQKLLSNDDYFEEDIAENTSLSHTSCQQYFLQRGTSIDASSRPCAMLIDGTWWQMEATATFDYMGSQNSAYSKENRKLGWMPLPQATKEEAAKVANGEKKTVYSDHLNAVSCVKSKLSEGVKKAALAFLQYAYTDESLANFTYTTGAVVGMDYLDALDRKQLNYYETSLVDYIQNSDIVYQVPGCDLYAKNVTMLRPADKYGSGAHKTIVRGVWDGKLNAKDYFIGQQDYFKSLIW